MDDKKDREILLTADGKGRKAKEEALQRVIARAIYEAKKLEESWKDYREMGS